MRKCFNQLNHSIQNCEITLQLRDEHSFSCHWCVLDRIPHIYCKQNKWNGERICEEFPLKCVTALTCLVPYCTEALEQLKHALKTKWSSNKSCIFTNQSLFVCVLLHKRSTTSWTWLRRTVDLLDRSWTGLRTFWTGLYPKSNHWITQHVKRIATLPTAWPCWVFYYFSDINMWYGSEITNLQQCDGIFIDDIILNLLLTE